MLGWLVVGAAVVGVLLYLVARGRRGAVVEPAATKPATAKADGPRVIPLAGVKVEVPDGDGMTYTRDGKRFMLRMAAIDAPEFPRQPLAYEARRKLLDLIAAPGTVNLRVKPATCVVREGVKARVHGDGNDRFGRLLVTVFDGERNVNEAMVESGLAWRMEAFDKGSYAPAEAAAKAAEVGVHNPALGEAIPPWEWRRRNPPKGRKAAVTEPEAAAQAAAAAVVPAKAALVHPALEAEPKPAPADDPTVVRPGRWWPWVAAAIAVAVVVAVVLAL